MGRSVYLNVGSALYQLGEDKGLAFSLPLCPHLYFVGLLCGWFLGFFLLNELSSLKLHPFVISKFYKQAWNSRLRVSQGRNQGIGWLCSYVDALEKYLLPNAFRLLSEWSSLEL